MVSRGEYKAPALAKPPPNSVCCRGNTVLKWIPTVRNAKYYRTIKKQEKQPHKLPFAKQDARANRPKKDTQETRVSFTLALQMDCLQKQ